MEVTQCLILVAVAASLLFAPTNGDILVQPQNGYPSPRVASPQVNPPKGPIVQPGYEESSSRAANPMVNSVHQQFNPPRNPIVQPGYGEQNPSAVNPQVKLKDSIVQPGYGQQNPSVINSQGNSHGDIIVQPGNEQQIPSVVNPQVKPPKDPIVQPDYGQQNPSVINSQGNSPRNIIVQPGYGRQSFVDPRIKFPREFIVQPGYGQQSYILVNPLTHTFRNIVPLYVQQSPSIVNPLTNSPRNIIVQPGYGQDHYNIGALQGSNLMNSQRQLALNYEIQRNKNLQQILANQLYYLRNPVQAQQFQQISPRMVGSIRRPLYSPHYFGNSLHLITPHGLKRHRTKKYKWGFRPLVHRTASSDENCIGKNQYGRSVNDESGFDSGLGAVHDVAAHPSIERKNVTPVVELPVTEIVPANDSTEKVMEPRQIGINDDGTRYEQYENQKQRNPTVSAGFTTRVMDTAKSLGQKIVDTISPMVGDPIYTEQRQNSGYTQKTPAQSSQNSKTYNKNQPPHQTTESYSATDSNMADKNRMVGSKRLNMEPYNHQKDYQPSYQPADPHGNQPGLQTAYKDDNQRSYRSGTQPGYQSGYRPGYQSGYRPGYQSGYRPGYQSGYRPGYQSGYRPGYQPGYLPGYHSDNQFGYQPGYRPGYHSDNQFGYQPGHRPEYHSGDQFGLQPAYHSGYQPAYQPSYQSHYGHPPIRNNQTPHGNVSAFSSAQASATPNSSTASATFSSGNNNYNSYRSPIVGTFVDQYGRTILNTLSSTFNTMMANPNTYAKNLYDGQLARVY